MNKKVLSLGLLSATALSALGTTTAFAAEETTGNTTVTYEPGTTSPTDATWAVSMPVNVMLNESHEATGQGETNKANSINTKGETMSFTVYDKVNGTSSHTGKEQIQITLVNGTTSGEIDMDKTSGQGTAPKMALVKAKTGGGSGTTYEYVKGQGTAGNVGTITNKDALHTLDIKAGISTPGTKVQKGDKFSKELTFKFTKTGVAN